MFLLCFHSLPPTLGERGGKLVQRLTLGQADIDPALHGGVLTTGFALAYPRLRMDYDE